MVGIETDELEQFGDPLGPLRRGQVEVQAQALVEAGTNRLAAVERLVGTGWRTNAQVSGRWLRGRLGPGRGLMVDLDRALDRGTLSLRGVDRVLRVAWTIADIEGRTAPSRAEVGRALLLRTRGQGA